MAFVLGAGCSQPPASCDDMCLAAAERMPECLEEWGQSWSDRGYLNADDFDNACETWVWEESLLEDRPLLDATCDSKRADWVNADCDAAATDAWSAITGS